MPGLEPWERLPGETAKAFAAFVAYRDLPALGRSAAKAAKSVKEKPRQFTRWSKKHEWIDRAAAYGDYLDSRKLNNNLDIIDAMSARQAENAMNVQLIGSMSVDRVMAEMIADPSKRLSNEDIIEFLTIGTALERTARGKSSSISEIIGTNAPVEVIWKGPAVASDDASDASRPVDGPTE